MLDGYDACVSADDQIKKNSYRVSRLEWINK